MTAGNAPLRTIVVEDEPLVRLMTEDVLTSIGCVIVASASTLNEALACIPATELDLAVLDVNLGGTEVYPAAELLRSRGTPIVFVIATSATAITVRGATAGGAVPALVASVPV